MRPVLLFFLIGVIFITALILIEKDNFLNLINKYFPFQAAIIETLPSGPEKKDLIQENKEDFLLPPEEVEIEEESTPEEENSFRPEIILTEIQNNIEEIAERIDSLSQEVDDLIEESQFTVEEIPQTDEEESEDKEKTEEEDIGKEESEEIEIGQEVGQRICEISSPGQSAKNKIIINEVAWMGGFSSVNDEWIELKSISTTPIDLTGWQLLDKESQIKIIFTNRDRVSVNGFYLLERTNDDSVPNISADLIYTGSLSDSNEALYLFSPVRNNISNGVDDNCQLEDEVEANPDWPAGEKSERRSMERKQDLSWQTSLNPGGTPKAENSSGYSVPPIGGGGTPAPEPTTYPKILISEVKIAEKIGDKNVFVELYNPNDFEVDLTGWYIFRNDSSFITKTLLEGEKIPPKGYFLIARKGSIWENQANVLFDDKTLNEDDKITLKSPKGEVVDEVSWSQIPSAFSLGRKWDGQNYGDFEIQNSTPKEKNISPAQPPQDNLPPQVTFSPIPSLQTTLSFTLSWTGEDLAPEGITPSGIEGFLLRYSEDRENWQNLTSETELTLETQYSFQGEDLKTYYFRIKAKDRAGNESDWAEIAIEINTLPVVINEIAWMGTEASDDDEWVELYNNTNQDIDLESWVIKSKDGSPQIEIKKKEGRNTIIFSKGYFLLERTEDDTISDILADQIYTGALGNSGEELELYDKEGNLIDTVSCLKNNEGNCKDWFAGKNEKEGVEWIRISMERKNPNISGNNFDNWATNDRIIQNGLDKEGNLIFGTPKSQNSVFSP